MVYGERTCLSDWLDLEFEGLYPVLTFAGEKYFSKKTLSVFHDPLAWLMQVAMFLTLGLLVFPSEVAPAVSDGVVLAMLLLFFARPLSVWICLLQFRYSLKEIWFVSWGGLRGAVPIILATYLLVNQVSGSKVMFNLVFFIVVFSMLVQGTTLKFFSHLMKVQEPFKNHRQLPFKSRSQYRDFVEFEIKAGSPLLGKNILDFDFPMTVLVVLIHRRERDFIPGGNTEIELDDRLVCLIETSAIAEFEKRIQPKA
jgi:cell volume regulation protein A